MKDSDIKVGDQILIRRTQKNKTASPFDPRPYVVIKRNGSQIVAKREEQIVERHVNHCKKLIGEPIPMVDHDRVEESDLEFDGGSSNTEVSAQPSESLGEMQQNVIEPPVVNQPLMEQPVMAPTRSLRPRHDLQCPLRYRQQPEL